MAVAHLDDRFGSGQSAFEVSKPLLIEPALPQFAHIGDQLVARAVVHNQSQHSGGVIVQLELDDKARAAATNQQIQIAAGGSEAAEFPVTLAAAGPAKWIWRAWFADAPQEFTDATECSLDVGYVSPLLHQTVSANRGRPFRPTCLPKRTRSFSPEPAQLTIRVSNTRLSELGEAVSQLLHYPYGCAEQTGSSMLPWIVLSDAPALRSVMGMPLQRCRARDQYWRGAALYHANARRRPGLLAARARADALGQRLRGHGVVTGQRPWLDAA